VPLVKLKKGSRTCKIYNIKTLKDLISSKIDKWLKFQNIESETNYQLLKLMVLEKQRFDSSNQHLHLHDEHQSG